MQKLVITDNKTKMKLLKENKGLDNVRYFGLNTLMDNLFGYLLDDGIYYLYKKFNLNIPFILNIKKYLKYIDINTNYNSVKLNELKEIKKALLEENLYVYDKTFINYLTRCEITFYHVCLKKEHNILLDYLNNNNIKYNIVNKEIINNEFSLYNLANIEEEVYFVFDKISKLLANNISPNNIYLVNCSEQYYSLLNRMSYAYKVDIELPNNSSFIDKEEVNYLLANLDDLESIVKEIKDIELYKYIINLINKYNLLEIDDIEFIKELFIYHLRKKKYSDIKYQTSIKLANIDDTFNDDDYIFLFNFNSDTPSLVKNIGFLSDNEADILGLANLDITNEEITINYLNNLTSIKNIVLTKPNVLAGNKNFDSFMLRELNVNVINEKLELGNNCVVDKLLLANDLDNFYDYNVLTPNLKNYDLSHVDYKTYDNKFKTFKLDNINSVKLSYSSMKLFFDCPFRYYLERVLDIKVREDTMSTNIGNYVHKLFEDSYKPNFDLASAQIELKKDKNNKDKFYLSLYDDLIKEIMEFNKLYEDKMALNQVKLENNIDIDNGFIKPNGKVDKMRYLEDNDHMLVAIFDYKTGNDEVSLNYIKDGMNLQLPMYLYLISKSNPNKDIKFAGIYLQKVKIKYSSNESFKYKPTGYTNIEYADSLVNSSEVSDYLANLKTNKDGSYSKNSKILTTDDIKLIIQIVEDNINKIKEAYSNNDFPIKPCYIDGKNKGCDYCKYNDICYKSGKDKVDLTNKNFKEEGTKDEVHS